MNELQIKELLPIDYSNMERPTVSGRELHDFLGINTKYADWFKRMTEYGFTEGEDFNLLKIEKVQIEGGRKVTRQIDDHQLTIQMAKELCMIQRNERGKQARAYFLKIEELWNSPDAIMNRALAISNQRVKKLMEDVAAQSVQIKELTEKNEELTPKGEYYDKLVDNNSLMSLMDTAKALEVKPKTFINYLIADKFLYRRSKKGPLLPYEEKNKGYFEVKDRTSTKTGWAGAQTLTTVKGREKFMQMRNDGYFD